MILAIDPGLRHCGCALFDRAELLAAVLVKNPDKKGRGPATAMQMAQAVMGWVMDAARVSAIETLVLEYPRVYPGLRDNDPNDLIELACVDGALAGWLVIGKVVHYYPSDWKGQTPANPTARQILKRLSTIEKGGIENIDAFFEALRLAEGRGRDVAHSAHNTLDAVGIGLKYLGRF